MSDLQLRSWLTATSSCFGAVCMLTRDACQEELLSYAAEVMVDWNFLLFLELYVC